MNNALKLKKKYKNERDKLFQKLSINNDGSSFNYYHTRLVDKIVKELVEKLKYCKSYDKYKVASILPDQIIKANELWVFNIKTRKLGKYVAKNIDPKGMGRDGTGLSVKGTTIIGFDETKSIQKTLRKPDDQIKEFKGLGKVKLRTFIDDIKTIDTKLTGRCNPYTLLLKAN